MKKRRSSVGRKKGRGSKRRGEPLRDPRFPGWGKRFDGMDLSLSTACKSNNSWRQGASWANRTSSPERHPKLKEKKAGQGGIFDHGPRLIGRDSVRRGDHKVENPSVPFDGVGFWPRTTMAAQMAQETFARATLSHLVRTSAVKVWWKEGR